MWHDFNSIPEVFKDCVVAYLTQYSNSVPVIKFYIDQSLMTIGQDIDMDICVSEDGIADNHASVEAVKQGESYRFTVKSREDESLLDINGNAVSHAELQDGDWLTIGGVEFQFTNDGVNEIKQLEISTPVTEIDIAKPQQINKEAKESDALTLIKEIKKEVESITTGEVEDSHFSRRLNFF